MTFSSSLKLFRFQILEIFTALSLLFKLRMICYWTLTLETVLYLFIRSEYCFWYSGPWYTYWMSGILQVGYKRHSSALVYLQHQAQIFHSQRRDIPIHTCHYDLWSPTGVCFGPSSLLSINASSRSNYVKTQISFHLFFAIVLSSVRWKLGIYTKSFYLDLLSKLRCWREILPP